MESCEVVVVGLGVMGAATLDALARRGVRAIGLERFDVPHALGSSHGGTRVIRKAYFEDARYVPLLHRAWDAWRVLERAAGEALLVETGALHFGPPDDRDLVATLHAIEEHRLAHERLTHAAAARRFPAFALAPGDEAVLESEAGVLLAERCLVALVERALAHGAIVHAREPLLTLEPRADGVELHTANRAIAARRAVLTLGPWWAANAPIAPPLPLAVTRQVQLWVRPHDPAAFELGRLPVFLRYDEGLVYGMPSPRGAQHPGLKLASHRIGAPADPDAIDRAVSAADLAPVRAFLARYLPGADGPLLGARTCMYTSSPDHHFALGPHPDVPAVVVGAGFSGHGFKLAPVVGEILADFALEGASALTLDLFDPRRRDRKDGAR